MTDHNNELNITTKQLKSNETTVSQNIRDNIVYKAEAEIPKKSIKNKLFIIFPSITAFIGGFMAGNNTYNKEDIIEYEIEESFSSLVESNEQKAPIINENKSKEKIEVSETEKIISNPKSKEEIEGLTIPEKIYNYFNELGLPEAGIAAIMANIDQESRFITSGTTSEGIQINNDNHYGLFQWTDDNTCSNRTNYLNYCIANNLNPDDLKVQLDYFWQDFQKSEYFEQFMSYAYNNDAYNAAMLFAYTYEAPDNLEIQASTRAYYAEKFYQDILNNSELHSYRI